MSKRIALRARWVVPVNWPPIDGGVVTIEGERIVAVGREPTDAALIDLGDVALLPGFVNAHTHLEFSDLAAPLGTQGMSLPDWIRLVIRHRHEAKSDAAAAVVLGLRESARWGVTTIGEIAQFDWSAAALESVPLGVTVFLELIGLSAARLDALAAVAERHVSLATPPHARWRTGVSPHAPYSVQPEVIRRAAKLAAPLAIHLAESREELELLATASGPMRTLLEELGVWRPELFGDKRPLDYLNILNLGAERCRRRVPTLAIHGNYLDAEEQQLLRDYLNWSVVYCPRTHAFFDHDRYPLLSMKRRGIVVAIGTDSRASNPDLSVLAELRHVARQFPEVPPGSVLAMGTLSGAAALGLEKETGVIAPGFLADLVAVRLDHSSSSNDPAANVLAGSGDVVLTIAAGTVVHDPSGLIGPRVDCYTRPGI